MVCYQGSRDAALCSPVRTVECAASEKNGPISNFQLDHNQSSSVILVRIISAISPTNCQRPHNLLETLILWAIHAHLVRIISPHLHHHAIDSSSLPSPSTAIKLRTRIHTPQMKRKSSVRTSPYQYPRNRRTRYSNIDSNRIQLQQLGVGYAH